MDLLGCQKHRRTGALLLCWGARPQNFGETTTFPTQLLAPCAESSMLHVHHETKAMNSDVCQHVNKPHVHNVTVAVDDFGNNA